MLIRRATIKDLYSIVAFIAEEGREAEGREQDATTLTRGIATALKDKNIAQYWLLVDETQQSVAAGCISIVKEWSDWNAGWYWWIQSCFIAPAFRGKGNLNVMISSVMKEAREQNCLQLRLYVHKQNKVAIRAYEKVGFEDSPYAIMSMEVVPNEKKEE